MSATNRLGQPIGEPVPGWIPAPWPPRAVLQGRYCRLEPLTAGRHAAALHDANLRDADGSNWTYLPIGPFSSFDEYARWVAEAESSTDPHFFAIVLEPATAGAPVGPAGVASYLRITPAAGSIEVGHINFSPLMQRTPAATESMYLMMRWAFDHGYRRYEWKCDALNAPSRAAAQRLGLSYEGIFRQALVYKGRNRDTAWYAAIDREWPALRDAFERWLDPSNFDERGRQRVRLSALTAPLLAARG